MAVESPRSLDEIRKSTESMYSITLVYVHISTCTHVRSVLSLMCVYTYSNYKAIYITMHGQIKGSLWVMTKLSSSLVII